MPSALTVITPPQNLLTLENFAQQPREPMKPGNHNGIFLLFHLLPWGHLGVFCSHKSQLVGQDNPTLSWLPTWQQMQPWSTCWWLQTLSVLRFFFFFPPQPGTSCPKPTTRLSLWFPSSSPPDPAVNRLLCCGFCPTLLLLGFKTCYPKAIPTWKTTEESYLLFCVWRPSRKCSLPPPTQRRTEDTLVRSVLVHPWRKAMKTGRPQEEHQQKTCLAESTPLLLAYH